MGGLRENPISTSAAPLKTVLKTSPRGRSPEPSPPRSPVSMKSVTFAPVPMANEAHSISSSSSGSRKAERSSNGSGHRRQVRPHLAPL